MTTSTGPAAPAGAPFRLLDTLFADEPMRAVWSEAATVTAWLDVEAALAAAQAEVGLISAADAEAIGAELEALATESWTEPEWHLLEQRVAARVLQQLDTRIDATLDTALREHFAGFRSHSTLLGGLPAVLVAGGLFFGRAPWAAVVAGLTVGAGIVLFLRIPRPDRTTPTAADGDGTLEEIIGD